MDYRRYKDPVTIYDMITDDIMTAESVSYIWTLLDTGAFGIIVGSLSNRRPRS